MGNCPWSIRWGTSEETTTKCDLLSHTSESGYHEGTGLFPEQRIRWFPGDRREYQGEWPGYCDKLPGATFKGGCTLPARHPGRCAP